MTYEGWTNYQTWAVNLWLANDEPLYRVWTREAERAWELNSRAEGDLDQQQDDATRWLADTMKDEIESHVPTLDGPWCDLLSSALSEVDWREISAGWIVVARTAAEEAARGVPLCSNCGDCHDVADCDEPMFPGAPS